MPFAELLVKLRDDVILRRTGYTAIVNGKEITGCGECPYNETHTPRGMPIPYHTCSKSFGWDGKPLPILDPFNIPEQCLMRAVNK